MQIGDHIYVNRCRGLYSHHGIYCGGDSIIHFNGANWLEASVHRTTMDDFARGDTVHVRDYSGFQEEVSALGSDQLVLATRRLNVLLDRLRGLALAELDFSPQAVVHRAEGRLGETGFNLGMNNCEHFASWCKTGISCSRQIEAIWRLALNPGAYFMQRASSAVTGVPEPRFSSR